MNKAELIDRTLKRARGTYDRSVNKADVEGVLGALGEIVAEGLKTGDEIPLPGLGKLKVKQTVTRQGRNPRTGEALTIPARRKAVFTEGKDIREALNARS